MVLSSEKKNQAIIRELKGVVTDYVEDAAISLEGYVKHPVRIGSTLKEYSAALMKHSSDLKKTLEIIKKIVVLLENENIELEKEREFLLKVAQS